MINTIISKLILAKRDFPGTNRPLITFSIPANSKRNAKKKITEIAPMIGLINTTIDKNNISSPNPIWMARSQLGDFCEAVKLMYLLPWEPRYLTNFGVDWNIRGIVKANHY